MRRFFQDRVTNLMKIFLDTDFPGHRFSWTQIFLGTDFPGHRFSWAQIFLDTDSRPDSYSDTDSTKQAFDLSNQTLNKKKKRYPLSTPQGLEFSMGRHFSFVNQLI